ncbi:S8 family serine peptidase [Candidatus Poribacteria bacterium]|nr:S8 family serine peptidase [Candidatus Poribacteria bacterium]
MTKLIAFVFSLLTFLCSLPSLAQNHSASQVEAVLHTTPGELILRLRPGTSHAKFHALNQQLGAIFVAPVFSQSTSGGRSPKLSRIYLVRFPDGWRMESVIEKYKRSRWIEAVEPNYLSRSLAERIQPSDPRFSEQWNIRNINMPEAWAIEQGNPAVIIAVVDSGIEFHHEDLRSKLWRNPHEIPGNGVDDDRNGYIDDIDGWDFSDAPTLPGRGDYTERDNEPRDETGHGTHVSGIIAAAVNNNLGVAGIAWNCRVMPLRAGFVVAGGGAFLQNDDTAAAIVYAADNGAKVINLSWGDIVDSFVIHDAVEYAYHRGCVLIASAGNSHEVGALFPAALKTVIAVAATQQNSDLAFVSNFGASVDIAAPGDAILSTELNNTYGLRSGTSMAAPHVSGVAALLLSKQPELPNEKVRRVLIFTTKPIKDSRLVGAGLIDAEAALTAVGDLTARISAPDNFNGSDDGLEIVGTAAGNGFGAYRLEFGKTEIPDRWIPIGELQQNPKFNEVLTRWDTSQLQEGVYTLRLTVIGEDGENIRDKVIILIDHSSPEISEHQASLWLSRDRFDSMISWRTDDLTIGEIAFRRVGSHSPHFERIQTGAPGHQHTVNLSGALPQGEYEYRLTARNAAGGMVTDDNDGQFHRLRVTNERISPHRLQLIDSPLPALHLATGVADFNGNGKPELVAMELGGASYAAVQILEGYQSIFATTEAFLPWAIGDTDGDGLIEILGNRNEQTFLVEGGTAGAFPTERIWEVDGIWGGQIFDLDGDGRPEIISRHNETNAIWVHEAVANNRYRRTAILINPTDGRNGIGTTYALGDFDGDGKAEIVIGDEEGDLFIYEGSGDNLYRQTWLGKIGASKAWHLAAGDLDRDGVPEFVIGGQSATDGFDLPVQHWIFTIFKTVGNDSYEAVWTQRIREVRSGGNGLTIADADNDGQNELAISVWPNFYLIQHDGTDYRPVWYHSASSTFRPFVADIDSDGRNELMFNDADTFQIFGTPTPFPNVQPPWALAVNPINERSIQLRWQAPDDATGYTIYRGPSEDSLAVLREGIHETRFIDEDVKGGSVYWYAVASSDSAGKLSGKSSPVSVIPTSPPRLMSVEYFNPDRLILHFDKQMAASAGQPNRYRLNEIGSTTFHSPRSALLDQSSQRVITTFAPNALRPLKTYEIQASALSDINGTLIAEDANILTLTVPESVRVTDLSAAMVYPNPVQSNHVIFDRLPENATIEIYDVTGARVASLALHFSERGKKVWNLHESERIISNGVYIYRLEVGDESRSGKLSIIR